MSETVRDIDRLRDTFTALGIEYEESRFRTSSKPWGRGPLRDAECLCMHDIEFTFDAITGEFIRWERQWGDD